MAISISFADDETTDKNQTILIVDDEPSIVNLLRDYLSDSYQCITASSGTAALQHFQDNDIAVVLSDVQMHEMSGLELLPLIHEVSPNTVCLMVSGEQSMETAIRALQVGAVDFIRKPFALSDVGVAVARAIDRHCEIIDKLKHDAHLQELVNVQKTQLDFLKNCDPLTGLFNHSTFTDTVIQALADRSNNQTNGGALAIFSLERFKAIKDSFGKDVSDDILHEIAGRWINELPADAVLARFETDEFGLLLPKINCSTDAIEVLRALSQTLKDSVDVGSHKFHFSISAGISIFPNDGTDAASLEKFAAIALRHSKANGGSIAFYKPEMNRSAERRMALENGLKKALETGDIVNYYQPKIDFNSGKIVGMEALVRWNNSELGPISASEIIEIAEETGLIELLGLRVLENACRDTSLLNKDGFDLQVSVNLSGQQLANDWFPKAVDSAIHTSDLPATCLELEITETSLIQNPEAARTALDTIRSLGVRLAIDDFGTGFSSLSYLKQFPLDTLKVDRMFVCDLESRESDADFVHAIVALAQKLNLRTVVEGVETTEQLDLLRSTGCDEWQGFLCSKPLPFAEFQELVRSSNGLRQKRPEKMTSISGLEGA